MAPKEETRYAFVVEWYDPSASLVRKYQLIFYTADGTLEMYDLKNRRTFLKRCDYPGVGEKDLFKGGIITVYSRQLTVVEYADSYTASVFEKKAQTTVAVVTGEAIASMGRVIDAFNSSGFVISELALLQGELALALTGDLSSISFSDLLAQINSQLGEGAVVEATADVFSAPKPQVFDIDLSTLLLIRPHAVKAGLLGRMVDQVMGSGFRVLNMKMVQLSRPNAQEFLEVYKGVVPEYADWVEELTSGKGVALQLVNDAKPEATVMALRELCGAHDPEIATHLHPHSLRAQYGENKTKNAVHCTDLPEDGPLEVDYFFTLL